MSATDARDTIDSTSAKPSLSSWIRNETRNAKLDLRVAAPGQVVSYNPLTQDAVVVMGFLPICIPQVGGFEIEVPEAPLIIPAARVCWMQGTTHYDIAPMPIPGDTGLLIFCDRATDQWLLADGSPKDPILGRTHDLADAFFLPGPSPNGRLPIPPLNPLARTIEAPIINLGGALPAIQPVLRGTLLATALTAYSTALTAGSVALDAAATTWAAVIPPTIPGNNAFAAAFTAWTATVAAAQAALIAAVLLSLSTKVFVE